ncbi:hypothetical protein E0E52_14520 [Azotobacter chroococcum]|uniref:hypothetical protein n=1 Tax=Azotobacter chroococcum TaxID=353 RepID=UPI00103C5AFD|nr:hypothetical protein [Azotobacter chroococcum]TBW03701.1 hypothetical protein E0E52_14520 [Azotobacter chroococcum]
MRVDGLELSVATLHALQDYRLLSDLYDAKSDLGDVTDADRDQLLEAERRLALMFSSDMRDSGV